MEKCHRGEDCWVCRDLTPEELEMARKYWTNEQEMLEALLEPTESEK